MAEEAKLANAVRVIEDELAAVAMENRGELLAELAEDHEAMRERANEAVAQLDAAAGAMRQTYAGAMTFAQAVADPALNANLADPLTAQQIMEVGAAPELFRVPVPTPKRDDSQVVAGDYLPNDASEKFMKASGQDDDAPAPEGSYG